MEMEKKLWIRPVTFNLVSVAVVAALIMLMGVVCTFTLDSVSTINTDLRTDMEETIENADESLFDVEGYSVIFKGMLYGFVAFGELFVVMVAILCGFGAFIVFFPALLARLLYKNSNGRILAYRIIMGIDYVIITAIALVMLGGMELSAVWLIPLGMLAIVVCGIINTYSERIRR